MVRAFERLHTQILSTDCWRRARELLERTPSADVIVTSLTLPDANWTEILRYVIAKNLSASIVVSCSRPDERVWSELVWRGVHDVLVEPHREEEVLTVLKSALRASQYSAAQHLTSS